MSEHRRYVIMCDHPECPRGEWGKNEEVPSWIRSRLEKTSWLSRRRPPSRSQKTLGIYPTARQDFCPEHAPLYQEAQP